MPLPRLARAAACAATVSALALSAAAPAAAQPAEATAPADARETLAVTLYNQGAGIVFDRRAVDLPAGRTRLTIPGLPREAREDGVLLLGHDQSLTVHDQRLDTRLPTQDVLLAASVGQEITVERLDPATGAVTATQRARVLAGPPAPLFEIDGKIYPELPGRPVFDALPEGVTASPLWRGTVEAAAPASAVTLAYMTGGLFWQADYVAVVGPDGKTLSLDAFATLRNDTGTTLPADTVKLVAGDIARAPEPQPKADGGGVVMMEMARASAPGAPEAERQQLGAFHLYTLPDPVTLPASSTVQAGLLNARAVPVETEYHLEGQQRVYYTQSQESAPVHVEARLTFRNTDDANLGKPLPAGTVRVFRADADGLPQLVGADTIDHVGEGRDVTLTLGRAFDVTAERTQTDFQRLSDRVTETAHRIILTNGRDEAVDVRVVEMLPGSWEILSASQEHEKVSASEAAWTVTVPANGNATLTYRARTQF